MQVVVLGSKGMLGQSVYSYFSKRPNCEVHRFDEPFTAASYGEWGGYIGQFPSAVIINCIGRIKQKWTKLEDLVWANSVLPLAIADRLAPSNFLVHASTDCVFSGKKGEPYSSEDRPDATDAYGWSKRMGEIALSNIRNALVVRVSIVGLNRTPDAADLLSWFFRQPAGSLINGYTNHLWNGVTTLEWAKQVEKLIRSRARYGIVQLGVSDSCSKHELLEMFSRAFERHHTIVRIEHDESIDRRLVPDIICPTLSQQLDELSRAARIDGHVI